jgi:hypothetical protein
MAKKIQIDIEVNGKMQKATVSAKKLNEALKNTETSAHSADRRLKGASQQSANTTKNFSKMAQGISGGLVPAYATLAANVFALSAAYNFLKRAGDLAALRQAQTEYAYSTGQSMKLLTSRIQEATGGLLTFEEAAQAGAIGTAAGLSSDQLEGLATVAKKASAALGRDLTDSFNRLTRGAIKAEPELLDELGIIIRLNDVTETYKRRLKITGRELNTFEKSQAVVNAVLEQGQEKFEDIGDAQNDIAKLGKATDDLVKTIQTGIVPVATFIAEVFSKNILALGAAATVMGVQLIKAIAPAAPALGNLGKAAEDARKRMKKIAGPSVIGKEIKSGSFEERQIRAIEKASTSKTSKVINLSKMEREAIKRDLILIKADHARTMAANTTGFTKYTAGVKAQFYVLAAEHGKLMGGMRLGVAGLASFASKAMNAVAILGVITLAISLAKELMNLLKSDELRDLERRAGILEGRFAEQNQEVSDLIKNLKDAKTPMEQLVQTANLLGNISFSGVDGLEFQTVGGKETKQRRDGTAGLAIFSDRQKDLLKENEVLAEVLPGLIKSLELKEEVLQRAGINTTNLGKEINTLKDNLSVLEGGLGAANEGQIAYDNAVRATNAAMTEGVRISNELGTALTSQANAIKGLESVYQNFLDLQAKFQKPQSNLTQAFDVVNDLRDKLQTALSPDQMSTPLSELFSKADMERLNEILQKDVSGLTGTDLIGTDPTGKGVSMAGDLDIVAGQIRALELAQLTDKHNIEKDYQATQRSGIPFLQKEGKELKQIALINRKIKDIEDLKTVAKLMGIDIHSTVMANMTAEQKALEEQKKTIEFNTSEIGEAAQKMGSSLENNMTSAFTSIIDGTKSAKDAFADMARAMLADMAKLIAKMLVQRAIMAMFGFENGGVASGGFEAFGMGGIAKGGITGYASGGIIKQPTIGLVGEGKHNEAIVPLPDGKSIPVDIRGAGQNNNVTVNVAIDSQGNARQDAQADSNQGATLGSAIAVAVQKELQNQKRAGGILNPIGVS